MNNDVIKACDGLWASTIKKISIDFSNKNIQFDLFAVDNGVETNHVLTIETCSSICGLGVLNSLLHFDVNACDYYELTSIIFKQASFDLMIEIWEYKIGFNASSVVVDGKRYVL